MKTGRIVVMFAVTAVVMFFLNRMAPLTLMDDVAYRCVWVEDDMDLSIAQRPIETFADIVESQKIHYYVTNGRAVVHTVAQAVLAFVGENVSDVLNTLFFCLLVWLSARFVLMPTSENDKSRIVFQCSSLTDVDVAVFLFIFLFYILMPGFKDVFLYTLGCVNYLWTAVAVLLFLIYFYRNEQRHCTAISYVMCPIALLAGWTHEALTLPLSFGLCVWMAVERRRVLSSAVLPAVVCFMIGSALCSFSPATIGRAAADSLSVQQRMFACVRNLVLNMHITLLLLGAIAVTWLKCRDVLLSELQRHLVLYSALVPSIGLVLVCGHGAGRVCFHLEFLASLLLVSLFLRLAPWRRGRAFLVVAALMMAVVTIAVAGFALENGRNYDYQMAQQRDTSVEVIKVKQNSKTESRMFNALVKRYVLPSAVFGFNIGYQGFDADDINLRCAAVLYGKQRVIYLPEDVVEKMECDAYGYEKPVTGSCGNIAVMRLPHGCKVDSLSFDLRDECPDNISLYARFRMYKGNVYEMPEAKYKTIDVFGRTYLVFAVPQPNVSRRIKTMSFTSSCLDRCSCSWSCNR